VMQLIVVQTDCWRDKECH